MCAVWVTFSALPFTTCTEMTNGNRSTDSQVYSGLYRREQFWCADLYQLRSPPGRIEPATAVFVIIYCHDPMTSHHTVQKIRSPLFRSRGVEWNGGGGHSAQWGRFMWLFELIYMWARASVADVLLTKCPTPTNWFSSACSLDWIIIVLLV